MRQPTRQLTILASLFVSLVTSCSETVRIKSYPPGAKAYIDEEYIGTTPVSYSMPRERVHDGHKWRVEYSNCTPAEGTLATGIGGGRVVGYIFTAGLSAIFKGPRYFEPVDAELTDGDCVTARSGTATAPTSGGVTVTQIVGDGNTASKDAREDAHRRLSDRLITLRELYQRKLLTEEEYARERERTIRDFESIE